MDQQEWMGYVSRLANGEYPVPVGMIQDYNDWRCRSIVGRALYWMGDTESAMRRYRKRNACFKHGCKCRA